MIVGEMVLRFVIGGLLVSLFAVIGDVLRPKTFAGLFGAAPSIALASLGIAFVLDGGRYVRVEGRSMILGAVALAAYALVAGVPLLKGNKHTLPVAAGALAIWFAVALGLKAIILR